MFGHRSPHYVLCNTIETHLQARPKYILKFILYKVFSRHCADFETASSHDQVVVLTWFKFQQNSDPFTAITRNNWQIFKHSQSYLLLKTRAENTLRLCLIIDQYTFETRTVKFLYRLSVRFRTNHIDRNSDKKVQPYPADAYIWNIFIQYLHVTKTYLIKRVTSD